MDYGLNNHKLMAALIVAVIALTAKDRARNDRSSSEWERLINEWIFSERDRKILKRRLLDGVRFDPLAEEFELSVRRTKTIVSKGIGEIQKHCT